MLTISQETRAALHLAPLAALSPAHIVNLNLHCNNGPTPKDGNPICFSRHEPAHAPGAPRASARRRQGCQAVYPHAPIPGVFPQK